MGSGELGGRSASPVGSGLRTYSTSLKICPVLQRPPPDSLTQGRCSSGSAQLAPYSPQDSCCWASSPHRLGRRKLLILNYLQAAVSGSCTAFAPNFSVYCAFRFLTGMSMSGIALNTMTLSKGCLGAGGSPLLPADHPT